MTRANRGPEMLHTASLSYRTRDDLSTRLLSGRACNQSVAHPERDHGDGGRGLFEFLVVSGAETLANDCGDETLANDGGAQRI